jgi:hypothetical protein
MKPSLPTFAIARHEEASQALRRCPKHSWHQVSRCACTSDSALGKEPSLAAMVDVAGVAKPEAFSVAASRRVVEFLEVQMTKRIESSRPRSDQTRSAG